MHQVHVPHSGCFTHSAARKQHMAHAPGRSPQIPKQRADPSFHLRSELGLYPGTAEETSTTLTPRQGLHLHAPLSTVHPRAHAETQRSIILRRLVFFFLLLYRNCAASCSLRLTWQRTHKEGSRCYNFLTVVHRDLRTRSSPGSSRSAEPSLLFRFGELIRFPSSFVLRICISASPAPFL